jgi:hypothetical protein
MERIPLSLYIHYFVIGKQHRTLALYACQNSEFVSAVCERAEDVSDSRHSLSNHGLSFKINLRSIVWKD